MTITKLRVFAFAVIVVVTIAQGLTCAQPIPGDVFREYLWFNEKGDAGQSLRVGGRHGQEHPDRGWAHDYINAPVVLKHNFDLEHAVKAEVVVEKILCHVDTVGLAIRINDGDWIYIPEPADIPVPASNYQHHFYPVVRIPLSQLNSGTDNQFVMRVDEKHPWNWPQNLVNGVHFRVYYDSDKKNHPNGKIITPCSGSPLGCKVELCRQVQSSDGPIKQVDYVGFHEDVNFEGDGKYRQWHYHFFHDRIINHIGSATQAPYLIDWDTSWVPDQKQPMRIAARVIDETGMIYMTEAVEGLSLLRPGLSVELCKPYNIPKKWATNRIEKGESFDIVGDLSKAVAAQLVWSSWSPGYMNGIYINDKKVFQCEGPKYACYAHRVAIGDVSSFQSGRNILKTGKTPLNKKGKMVHGMEVNWPGIMVLIQYKEQTNEHQGNN